MGASASRVNATAHTARASGPPLVPGAAEPLALVLQHTTPRKPAQGHVEAAGVVVYADPGRGLADGATPAAAQRAASCLVSTDQNCHENPSCPPTVETSLDALAAELQANRAADPEREWMRALDRAWSPRARRRARELRARAFELAAAEGVVEHHEASPGRWHLRRASGLGRTFESRLDGCGKSEMVVSCACGRRSVKVACKQRWLCPGCQRRTYARMRARLARSFKRRVLASERAWQAHGRPTGRKRTPVLVTMTVRHTGDLLADRKALTDGWTKLRKWVHRRIRDTWEGADGKFDYALVWEVTPGRDGLGHVHAHAVVLWPWLDWNDVRAEWLLATEGRSSTIDLRVTDHKSGAQSARDASNYLAKYTSKGVNVGDFTPELAANVMDSLWQRRVCSTSRGFWSLDGRSCACPKCRQRFTVVERPPQRRAPDEHAFDPSLFWRVEHENGSAEERWTIPEPSG